MNIRPIRPGLLAGLTCLTALVASLRAPAQEPSAASPGAADLPPFRVLLWPDPRGADDVPEHYTRQALERLAGTLVRAGVRVIDSDQARLVGAVGGEGEDAQAAAFSRADVVVRLGVRPTLRNKIQGRYVVEHEGEFRISFRDSAERAGSGEGGGAARSVKSFKAAHDEAIAALCDPDLDDSLASQLLAALQQIRAEEERRGARIVVALTIDEKLLGLEEALRDAVAEAEGVVPGTLNPLGMAADVPMRSGGAGNTSEFGLRFRGGPYQLLIAVQRALADAAPAIEEKHAIDVHPLLNVSGRRLAVEVIATPSSTALAEEVRRLVGVAVADLYSRRDPELAGSRLLMAPAETPAAAAGAGARLHAFRRGLLAALDAAEAERDAGDRPAADLGTVGPVTIAGAEFDTVADARAKLYELEEAFYGSPEGALAEDLAAAVQQAFREVADGGVTIQPLARDRERSLDVIRTELRAYQDDYAVAPDSVAMYEQRGSGYLVATRVRPFIDQYAVAVRVLDLGTGQAFESSVPIHRRFKPQLDEAFGG